MLLNFLEIGSERSSKDANSHSVLTYHSVNLQHCSIFSEDTLIMYLGGESVPLLYGGRVCKECHKTNSGL